MIMHNTDSTETTKKNDVWNYEAMMERMLQNTSIAYTIINLFLKDAPIQLEKLKEAIEKGDSKEIRQYSHAIKGSVLNLGGEAMYVVAESIEVQALKGNIKRINTLYPLLLKKFKELEKLLVNHLEKVEK